MLSNAYDIVVTGGGIVGVASALELLTRYPKKRILIVEKEGAVAQHQTGRNSGVIHAGVYYAPGSLKAKLCRQGLHDTIEFCRLYNLPYEQCGKLIVATDQVEQQRLDALFRRANDNDLGVQRLTKKQLREREPNILGEEAIWVTQTGITNYALITETLVKLFLQSGGEIAFNTPVLQIEDQHHGVDVVCNTQQFRAQHVVNCCGMMTDRVASQSGIELDFKLLPFRGEYFQLPNKFNTIVKHLIYPVPDPELPFLGIHLTRMINGSVTVGPNAILALSREGYKKHQINLKDVAEMAGYKGFWKLLGKYSTSAVEEVKGSLLRRQYVKKVQRYCPQIQASDLLAYPSGIRAQAVDKDGNLIHDFKFFSTGRALHVGNAPSPAATSAMPIARHIADKFAQILN